MTFRCIVVQCLLLITICLVCYYYYSRIEATPLGQLRGSRPTNVASWWTSDRNHHHQQPEEDALLCQVTLTTEQQELPDDSLSVKRIYECIPNGEGDFMYTLPWNDEEARRYIDQDVNEWTTVSTNKNVFVSIPGARLTEDHSVWIPDDSTITQVEQRHLSTSQPPSSSSTRSLLLIRISAGPYMVPLHGASELYDFVFNTTSKNDPNRTSVATQLADCSQHHVQLIPAPSVAHGILELDVNEGLTENAFQPGFSNQDVIHAAIQQAQDTLQVQSLTTVADHIAFCLPWGSRNGGTASATLNGWKSTFHHSWCGSLSAWMHELGHNLGLLHAGQEGLVYNDRTGYMGASYRSRRFGPLKCYNGANHYQMGWYHDNNNNPDSSVAHVFTDEQQQDNESTMLSLLAFVDHSHLPVLQNQMPNLPHIPPVYTLAKVGHDLFLQYNRQKDYNRETEQMQDQLTVVQQHASGTSLLAGLTEGDVYTYGNETQQQSPIVIQVCSTHVMTLPPLSTGEQVVVDYMTIGVGRGVVQSSLCEDPSIAPTITAQPSQAPSESMAPTGPTTLAPSDSPSMRPSLQPSPEESLPPSLEPTTLATSVAPSIETTSQEAIIVLHSDDGSLCDDSHSDEFWVNDTLDMEHIQEYKRCDWLSARPAWQDRLCHPQHSAFHTCPETCGKCIDSCHDNPEARFTIVQPQQSAIRDCRWLYLRPTLWAQECQPGKPAYQECPETCNSCQVR